MESIVYNEDCMVGMARYPDKYFDLAIVDPPYGIGFDGEVETMVKNKSAKWNNTNGKGYERKEWDNAKPTKEYFTELFRVSKKQVIWGGNYFELPISGGWIVWDKKRPPDFSLSQGELAWVSGSGRVAIFRYLYNGFQKEVQEDRFHPTQKPVKLYKWILDNYAVCKHCKNEGGFYEDVVGDGGSSMYIDCESCDVAEFGRPKILDTHLGSGSSRIAAYEMGFDFVGFELDFDYYTAAEKRFNNFKLQLKLF